MEDGRVRRWICCDGVERGIDIALRTDFLFDQREDAREGWCRRRCSSHRFKRTIAVAEAVGAA